MTGHGLKDQPSSEQVHISISQQTPYIPSCALCVKTCQHTGCPGQCCSGLSGLTNCLVYVCLSLTWINLAWLDYGLSVCYPIIFPEPRPLNPLLLGQTCRSHVCCSCVTEGWTGQYCFNEAGDICLLVAGLFKRVVWTAIYIRNIIVCL